MLLNRLLACIKPYVICIPFFTVGSFMTACNGLPISNDKPVFTIANMPSFAEEEKTAGQGDLIGKQSEEANPLEDKKEDPVSTPKSLEPAIINTLPEETSESGDTIETKIIPEGVAVHSDIGSRKDIDETAEQLKQNKETIDNLKEPKVEELLKPKSLTIDEIASLIGMPLSNSLPPPLERIKLGALKNINDNELIQLIGKPDFVINNNQMTLWQYMIGNCIIDFFLKQNEYNHFVTYIDVRAQMLGNKINKKECELELANALNS